jgi:hypothetical protein
LKPTSISWQTQQVHVLQHAIGVMESAHGPDSYSYCRTDYIEL